MRDVPSGSFLPAMPRSEETAAPMQGESSWRRPALGTTHILVGAQQYEDADFWDPIEDGWFVGLDSSYENVDDWFGVEWGGALRFDDGDRASDGPQTPGVLDYRLDSDIEAYEASIGVRRTFLRRSSFRPYVGVGASAIYYELERKETGAPVTPATENYSDKKEHKRVTFGLYAHAGLEWQLSEYVMIGVDARVLRGTDLPNMMGNGDLDCERISLFFGYGG
jgi:opacity protein-like surface antigen